MATPELFENSELNSLAPSVDAGADVVPIRLELVLTPTPLERLAFEGLQRAAALNPRIMPAKEMKLIFPKQH